MIDNEIYADGSDSQEENVDIEALSDENPNLGWI